MSSQEQARALRDALLKDMQARKGFRRDHVDTETRKEWDDDWLAIITAALTHTTPQWSDEKPTKPWWYWWRYDKTAPQPDIHYLVEGETGLEELDDVGERHELGDDGHWSGPLSPPEETAS